MAQNRKMKKTKSNIAQKETGSFNFMNFTVVKYFFLDEFSDESSGVACLFAVRLLADGNRAWHVHSAD